MQPRKAGVSRQDKAEADPPHSLPSLEQVRGVAKAGNGIRTLHSIPSSVEPNHSPSGASSGEGYQGGTLVRNSYGKGPVALPNHHRPGSSRHHGFIALHVCESSFKCVF